MRSRPRCSCSVPRRVSVCSGAKEPRACCIRRRSNATRRASLPMRRHHRVVSFFRTPKGLLTIVFAILLGLALPSEGLRLAGPGLLGAVFAGGVIDVVVLRIRKTRWE